MRAANCRKQFYSTAAFGLALLSKLRALECSQLRPFKPFCTSRSSGDAEHTPLTLDKLKKEHEALLALYPHEMPWRISEKHWKLLLATPSPLKRLEQYEFMNKDELRDLQKAVLRESTIATSTPKEKREHMPNTIFLFIYDTTMAQHYTHNLVHSWRFGQNVVIDCGFEHKMDYREKKSFYAQFTRLFTINRCALYPYHITLCNLAESSGLRTFLAEDPFPQHNFMNLSPKPIVDQFDRSKLVYLSPDARRELLQYDPNAIYVIGGLVDKRGKCTKDTYAEAKRLGIECRRLPIDQYIRSFHGSKSLPIDHVITMLLIAKHTGDWNLAVQTAVPQRKRPVAESSS